MDFIRKKCFFLFLTSQVKRLFCQKLARCLCMKPAPSPSLDPTLICRKSLRLTAGNSYTHSPPDDAGSAPSIQSTENDTAKELLKEIRDLLKSQVHKQKEQCYEDEREEEMKQDWMLAAAVIDRICAITFAIFTIGGTLVFYILFAIHPWLLHCSFCSPLQPAMYYIAFNRMHVCVILYFCYDACL